MWNPPIALSPEEQKMAARTQKTRKFSHSTGFSGGALILSPYT